MTKHLFFLVALCFYATVLKADELTGLVIRVMDGDTVEVQVESKQIKVRLSGIDAPEFDQPYGRRSRDSLEQQILGKRVTVSYAKSDRYGRVLGKIMLDSRDINLNQVQNGMAWWYEYYKREQSARDVAAYSAAELAARRQKAGLWSEKSPINPYEWRSGKRGREGLQLPQISTAVQCGSKKYCREMRNCDEAKAYLSQCGLTRLDGDKDGVPCESICR